LRVEVLSDFPKPIMALLIYFGESRNKTFLFI